MGRPYIGPLIDFRVPAPAREVVERAAEEQEVPVDQLCREVFLAGLESVLSDDWQRAVGGSE